MKPAITGTSLRGAINAMCRSCIYDRLAAGNWRQQVTNCACPACALYPVRPVSKSGQKAPEIGIAEVRA